MNTDKQTDSLKIQDLFTIKAEVFVIPHSSGGTIHDRFREKLFEFGINPLIPQNSALGDVIFQPVPKESKLKSLRYIAYACSVQGQQSNYAAIWKIGRSLAMSFPKGIISIASPLLGTGAGGLDSAISYYILHNTFLNNYKATTPLQFTLCTQNVDVAQGIRMRENQFSGMAGRQIAFDGSIERVARIGYNKLIMDSEDYYFEYARKKYEELKSEWSSADIRFYEILLKEFKSASTGFEEFLSSYPRDSREYNFLLLCGQLITYIDSNAANKNEWNDYSDKRTMAHSNVRQNLWIENLLRFKINNNSIRGNYPLNVLHAFEYLENPGSNLMMLSDEHRKNLCLNIFKIPYNPETFHRIIISYFGERGIHPKKEINIGALATRILYTDEVSELWMEPKKRKRKIRGKSKGSSSSSATIDKTEQEDEEYDNENQQVSPGPIKAIFHSDSYAVMDALDYELYAKAIQEFLTLEETAPPLTIGIMAPWGKGKTTLMRFIEKKLKDARSDKAANTKTDDKEIKEEVIQSKVREVQEWLKDSILRYLRDKITGRKTAKTIDFSAKMEYPVVWFNAWRFLKNQEVWSAFGHEIIHQLVEQLPSKRAKEEFWFKLNLARIDKDAVRDSLYGKAIEKMSLIASAVIFIFAAVAAVSIQALNPLFWIVSLGPGIISFVPSWEIIRKRTPDIDTSKFLVQPDYKKDMGYVYQLEQDLVNIFKLLVDENKPAVIFIDDLDRCSPQVTGEIVEAINLFISSEDLKCFFVLGQDSQMVAASLDVVYEKVGAKLGDNKRNSSLGWSFMEKFVQLQFCIPVMNDEQRIKMLKSLMAENDQNIPDNEVTKKITEMQDKVRTAPAGIFRSAEFIKEKNELQKSAPLAVAALNEEIIVKTAEEFEDNNVEVDNLIINLINYLGNSPRSIKRFVNLYRFYRFLQVSGVAQEFESLDSLVLGQWVVLLIRWPQLIRCMQWDGDATFLESGSPQQKAKHFNGCINESATYKDWEELIEKNKWEVMWLKDKELFTFLKTLKPEASLERAFESGVF
jgi:hypothetical protein